MRNRIAIILCSLALIVAGAPAAPAHAAPMTCGNINEYRETPEPIIIARTCITWNYAPAGNKWTLHNSRIWNPPGAPSLRLYVNFFYNHSGRSADTTEVLNNETAIRYPGTVGPYTAKFEVWVQRSNIPYCMYMVPGSYHQEHHAC
jgi:hypothetical protein